jgi:hypothetical protein
MDLLFKFSLIITYISKFLLKPSVSFLILVNSDENFPLLISTIENPNIIGKKINNSLKGLKYSLMIKISLFDFRIIKNKIIDKNIKNDGITVIISNTFKKLTIKILEKTIFSPKLPSREKI